VWPYASLYYSDQRMTYYTRHSKMVALHYVCVDVPSYYLGEQMTYYTHHSKMAALRCVCVDVSSEYFGE
jgi:hypothetical protein